MLVLGIGELSLSNLKLLLLCGNSGCEILHFILDGGLLGLNTIVSLLLILDLISEFGDSVLKFILLSGDFPDDDLDVLFKFMFVLQSSFEIKLVFLNPGVVNFGQSFLVVLKLLLDDLNLLDLLSNLGVETRILPLLGDDLVIDGLDLVSV